MLHSLYKGTILRIFTSKGGIEGVISSGLFVNLCIFSFFVSIMIAIRIFLLQRLAHKYK
jgi:hypothetical protein